jgi:hypothetical protein
MYNNIKNTTDVFTDCRASSQLPANFIKKADLGIIDRNVSGKVPQKFSTVKNFNGDFCFCYSEQSVKL